MGFNKEKNTTSLEKDIESSVRKRHSMEVQDTFESNLNGSLTGVKRFADVTLGKAVGVIQMSTAMKNFAGLCNLQALKRIKETKEYKELKGMQLPDGRILKGTWADFCEVIGESVSNVDERLKNMEYFGEKALESMQAIGMGIRDLRRLRQVPQEELTLLIEGESLKVSDKDEALVIIEELAAKHRKEKSELNSKVEELTQRSAATDQLLEKKSDQIQRLEKDLAIAKSANSPAKVKQLEEERNQALSNAVIEAKFDIFKGFAAYEDAVSGIQDVNHPCDMDDACVSAMRQIVSRLMEGSARIGMDQVVIDCLKAELAGVDMEYPS